MRGPSTPAEPGAGDVGPGSRRGTPSRIPRRHFIRLAGIAGLAVACSSDNTSSGEPDAAATTAASTTSLPPLELPSDPFTLGVASGDPLHDRVVIWTRLAPDPTNGGGMPAKDTSVKWVVANDEELTDVVAEGSAPALADAAHAVHVDVTGLESDSWYWYRFEMGDHRSTVARTRTTTEPGVTPDEPLRVAHASCQSWGSGYYTAYTDIADSDVDLIVHCGDYIYEDPDGAVRSSGLEIPVTLAQYRNTWGLYKSEAPLQAAHAVAPWITTWDDHEVENNYQGDSPEEGSLTPTTEEFLARRAAAYRAWWEHTPTRLDPPQGPDMPINRAFDWGDLARFTVLDTRQFRSDQPCGVASDIGPRCDDVLQPEVTALGSAQEAWFDDQMKSSETTWNVVCQQIVMQQWRFIDGNVAWNLDQWDGYPLARDRALASLAEASNPVVLTGDVHSSWVGSLATDFDDPDSTVIGTEFVGPGISSAAPDILGDIVGAVLGQSPHVLWAEVEHSGWVLHEITPDEWKTSYRFVDDRAAEDGTMSDGGSFRLEPGGVVAAL